MTIVRRPIPYHTLLFLFGAFYYWIFPLIILDNNLLDGKPGVSLLDKYNYSVIKNEYYLTTIFLIISFIVGSIIPLKFKRRAYHHRVQKLKISSRDLLLALIPFFIFGQYTIYKARGILFKGYNIDYDMDTLGSIATSNSIFLVFYLYLLISKQNKLTIWGKWVTNFCLFSMIEFSVILLGLGSRMYVMIPTISILLYYIQTHNITRKLVMVVTAIILLFLGIGIWRISSSHIDWSLLLYLGGAEPLLTWISAISYFTYNKISLISVPYNFLTSFFNFIPTILFPTKGSYILPIDGIYDSPLGATNLLTSILADFGVIGGAILLMTLGILLTIIQYNWKSVFGKVYYCCLCGIIPFQLFRDSIPIINKMAIFNFLIAPIIIFMFIRIIICTQRYAKFDTR